MVDSRGGFLVENDDTSTAAEKRKSEQNRPKQIFDPPLNIDPAENPTCKECGSMEIDYNWQQVFGVCVCQKCKEAMPEKFSLLTKTECKEDYLLTDREYNEERGLQEERECNNLIKCRLICNIRGDNMLYRLYSQALSPIYGFP